MKKFLALLLALTMVMCLFAGCGDTNTPADDTNTPTDDSSTPADDADSSATGDQKIAIIPMSLNDPYQIMMANAAKMKCDELGIEGVIQVPGSGSMGDIQGQVELVENIIANGTYTGVVLAPISAEGGNISVKNLQDAGIPVVIMDSQVDQDALEAEGYEKVPFVGTGNLDAAINTGKWIRENYPEGVKMAKINGADGHSNGEARKAGIDEGLDGWANIVAQQSTTWSVDDAYTATQNIISANPDVELIWCACDALGIGCIRALEEAGLQGQIDVIAFDGTNDGLQQVLDGNEVANTAQFPDVMGMTSVEHVVKLINGEDVDLVFDSGHEIIVKDTAQELMDRLSKYL